MQPGAGFAVLTVLFGVQHVRYLEQYRVDSIFRIFGLKAHVKVSRAALPVVGELIYFCGGAYVLCSTLP